MEPLEETIMTYQSDPNTNRRNDIRDDTSYTHWIIGGVVALAIVIAAAAFISTGGTTRTSPKQPRLFLLLLRHLQRLAPIRHPQRRQTVKSFAFRSTDAMDA